jgi:regulator of replication initiation timing
LKKVVASYSDFNARNFYSQFLSRYFEYKNCKYDKKLQYDAVFRLQNSISLTTNECEGFNSDLNYTLGFKKPTLIELAKLLRQRHAFSEEKLNECMMNKNFSLKNKKTKEKYEYLIRIIDSYDCFVVLDFLKTTSKVYK